MQVVCLECGAVNRLPEGKDGRSGQCGRCRTGLFAGHPKDTDAAMLDRAIARSDIPVVVDIWAPWCGPCRTMAPEFAKVAQAIEPRARFLKLNSDQAPQKSAALNIRGIPTMIVFKGGREIGRVSGAMSAAQIERWLAPHLG